MILSLVTATGLESMMSKASILLILIIQYQKSFLECIELNWKTMEQTQERVQRLMGAILLSQECMKADAFNFFHESKRRRLRD